MSLFHSHVPGSKTLVFLEIMVLLLVITSTVGVVSKFIEKTSHEDIVILNIASKQMKFSTIPDLIAVLQAIQVNAPDSKIQGVLTVTE